MKRIIVAISGASGAIFGSDDDIKAMYAAGPPNADRYLGAATPLRALVGELLCRKDLRSVSIRTKDLQLVIGR